MNGWTLTITRPCPTCKGGKEKPFHQWCGVCGQPFAPSDLGNCAAFQRDVDPMLPCGHGAFKLREENYCEDCEDTGVEYRTVTLWELAEIAEQEAANAPVA